MPSELRKANVSIVPRTICGSSESYGRTIVDGMVCANGFSEDGITDVCQGGEFYFVNQPFANLKTLILDSGGPLTCNYMLVGLASFGAQCGLTVHFPGVFTDVYYYRDWIRDNSAGRKIYAANISIFLLCFVINHVCSFKL